jgi:hypothetical protein
VHKISIYIHIYKNRKGKRKNKKERIFSASWVGGGGGVWPSRARACGIAAKWAQTAHEERGRRGGCRGCEPTRQRKEGGDGVRGRRAVRGGSSPVVWFCVDGMVAKHERR